MSKRTLYLLTLLELIWFAAAWRSAQLGIWNDDEAWYLTASDLVYKGQVPYRDFAFTQGPVFPYVYGAALSFLGTNLATGRFVTVALSAIALALVLNLAHRLGGRRAAIVAFILLLATPDVIYYFSIIKTYSLSAVLTLWALALVLHHGTSPSVRWPLLSTLAAGLSVLARPSFLPLLALVFAYWVSRRRGRASGLGLLGLGLLTLVVAASSNGNLLFDVYQFHLGRVPFGDDRLASLITLALATLIVFAPALVMALFLLILWCLVPGFRVRLSGWWQSEMRTKILFVLVAACLAIVHYVAPAENWQYQIPGYLVIVVLLAGMTTPIGPFKAQHSWTLLLCVFFVVSSVALWSYRSRASWQSSDTLQSASKASEILAQRGKPGDELIGGLNHLALASGVRVYGGGEMGNFSIADREGLPEMTLRHFLSEEAVTDALTHCSARFAATDKGRLYTVLVPSIKWISDVTTTQWQDLLRDNYSVIYTDGKVDIFERTAETCGPRPRSVGDENELGGPSLRP